MPTNPSKPAAVKRGKFSITWHEIEVSYDFTHETPPRIHGRWEDAHPGTDAEVTIQTVFSKSGDDMEELFENMNLFPKLEEFILETHSDNE